ncbi:MAG: phosphohydrolase [Bacteroidota bacterium]|jgi:uncharacterized protein
MTPRFQLAHDYMMSRLERELSPRLHYHNVEHVRDVLSAALRIGQAEGVDTSGLELIGVAAVFHDSGFILDSKEHEATGVLFARDYLPGLGFSENELEVICGMIMATRVPQQPLNDWQMIICDADLDYLGRKDFFETGNKVFREMVELGQIATEREWNEMQVRFLTEHHYFTQTSIRDRKPQKDAHLEQVKLLLV